MQNWEIYKLLLLKNEQYFAISQALSQQSQVQHEILFSGVFIPVKPM